MFQTLKNAWSMPELRKKMLYTLFIILIFRFGSCIPVPFIDTTLLSQYFEQASVNGCLLYTSASQAVAVPVELYL